MIDLDIVADELYALGPRELDRFAARRAELVTEARDGGDRALAREIGALKKPVQAAALANALVRSQPAALAELSQLAAELRDAHRHLRGAELRELSARRQQVLGRLTQLAGKVAGRAVGETVLGQLRATFEAAIADEAAERAVLSGRLTAALSYSGFGEVDLSDAVALPRRLHAVPDLPASAARTESGASPAADPMALRRAERALERAESASVAAVHTLSEAADQLAQASLDERELARRIEDLQAQLAAARDAAGKASRTTASADREHGRAQRAAERAEHAQQLAEADLAQLTGPVD
ncbi:MAG: hypothetical protein ACR2N4_07285 [Jatrophihabitans sp.]